MAFGSVWKREKVTFGLWRSLDPRDEAKEHLVVTIDRPSRTIHSSSLAAGDRYKELGIFQCFPSLF